MNESLRAAEEIATRYHLFSIDDCNGSDGCEGFCESCEEKEKNVVVQEIAAIIERHWRICEAVLLAKLSEQRNKNARDDLEPIALGGWRNDMD